MKWRNSNWSSTKKCSMGLPELWIDTFHEAWNSEFWVASKCFWPSSSLRIYIYIYIYIYSIFFFLLYPPRIAFANKANCRHKLCKLYLIWNKLVVVLLLTKRIAASCCRRECSYHSEFSDKEAINSAYAQPNVLQKSRNQGHFINNMLRSLLNFSRLRRLGNFFGFRVYFSWIHLQVRESFFDSRDVGSLQAADNCIHVS